MKRFNAILVILLVIQLGLIVFLDRPWSTEYTPASESPLFFPGFAAEQAGGITITQGDKRLVLIKDSAWFVEAGGERFAANFFYVDTLLNGVQRIDRRNLHSRNPDKVKVFGLDGEAAIRLDVRDRGGESLVSLLVGKNLGPSQGTYVKEPGVEEVYLVMEDLRYACVRGDDWVASWRDDSIVPLDPESIEGLRVESPNGAWALEEIPEEMVEALTSLKADGFAPMGTDPAHLGMNESDLKIVIRHGKGESTLVLSPDREGYRYLMLDGNAATLYRVRSYIFQPFLVKPGN